jgi:hypothetical protein
MPSQYTPGPLPFMPFLQVELTCEWCSDRFLVIKSRGHRRYCSFRCYTAARRDQSERTLHARAWAMVDRNGPLPERRPELGPCWLWTGARTSIDGYGHLGLNGDVVQAHRVTWESVNGPIPKGLELDHLCRTRSCVRPDHLEPVTTRENLRRGDSPAAIVVRTRICRRGHPMTPENTRRPPGGAGCKRCHADRYRARYVPKPRAPRLGEATANAKLTEDDVREIRELSAAGVPGAELGRTYGVTREAIYAVVKRRVWAHVD